MNFQFQNITNAMLVKEARVCYVQESGLVERFIQDVKAKPQKDIATEADIERLEQIIHLSILVENDADSECL